MKNYLNAFAAPVKTFYWSLCFVFSLVWGMNRLLFLVHLLLLLNKQEIFAQMQQHPVLYPHSISQGDRGEINLNCDTNDAIGCNLICNPDLFSDNCAESIDIFGYGGCENFSGWGTIATCDYFVTEANAIISPGALGLGVYESYETEALTTGVETEVGKKYLLSYVRKAVDEILTPNNDNGIWEFPYLPQTMGVALGYRSNIPPDPVLFGGIQPDAIPFENDQQIVSDTNFPDTEWRQMVSCFTANATTDALYFWLEAEDHGHIENQIGLCYSLIDHVELIEDLFPNNSTVQAGCDPISIGDFTCSDNLDLFHFNYTWERSVDNGATWVPMTENTALITVTPTTIPVLYRITRSMNNGNATWDVIGATCANNQAIIKVVMNDILCCLENQNFQSFNGLPDLDISTNQTLTNSNNPFGNINTNTNTVNINGTISIGGNASVIMNNLTLNFGPNGRIVVKPGANLLVNNCRLKGLESCKTMWQGIRIYKTVNEQAILSLTNNTLISDAIVGISTQNLAVQDLPTIATNITSVPDFQNTNLTSIALSTIWTDVSIRPTAGGAVIIDGAEFRNCFQGINLSWKPEGDYDLLNNITFKSTQSLYYPFEALTQSECGICGTNIGDRIEVQSSLFKNLKYGIWLNNFNYLAVNPTLDEDGNAPPTNPPSNFPCSFQDCQVGISARDLLVFNTLDNADKLRVWYNNFNRCQVGIQFQATRADVRGNSIDNQGANFLNKDIGIFALGSTFNIIDNLIENTARGIVLTDADDIGAANIHDNYLDRNRFGIVAIGNNPTAKISCNHLQDYSHNAIALTGWPLTGQIGNIPNQGVCSDPTLSVPRPAANFFLPPNGGAELPDVLRLPNSNTFLYSEFIDQLPAAATGFEFFPMNILQSCGFSDEGYNPETRCMEEEFPIQGLTIDEGDDEAEQNRRLLKLLYYYMAQKDTAAIYDLLNGLQTRLAKRLLVATKTVYSPTDDITAMLDAMPKNTEEDVYFDYFYRLLWQKKANNESLYDLSAEQEQMLTEIAQSKSATAHRAQAWLYAAKGQEFDTHIGDIDIDGWVDIQTTFKKDNKYSAKLYPNPAQNIVNLAYYLDKSSAHFRLYDIMGRCWTDIVLSGNANYLLDTANFPAGVYMAELVSDNDGKVWFRDKLVITK
jgi:hypothetical protein